MRALLLLALLVLLPAAYAVTGTASISPVNGTATTTSVLHCEVTATGTGTLSANITWYRNGAPHAGDDETLSLSDGIPKNTSGPGDIESGDTTRGQDWICQATLENGTATTLVNSSVVTIANAAPILTSPTTARQAWEDQAFSMTATATDPDGDPILAWLSADLNASQYGQELFSIGSNGEISFTPDVTEIGNHTMAISVSDGDLVGGRNIIFVVNEVDDAPELDPLTDQEATEAVPFSYIISGSDEEGDPFNFSMQSDIPSLTLTSLNATHAEISFTPAYSHGGLHVINLTIYAQSNTSHNTTGNFTLNVTVNNQIPIFDNHTHTPTIQGGMLNLTINATDADATDEILFSVDSDCSLTNPWTITTLQNSSSNAIGEIVVGTLTNDHVACRNITVTATDHEDGNTKASTNITIALSINNTNDAPSVHEISLSGQNTFGNNLSDLTAPTGLSFVYVVNATDPDQWTYEGENLTYTDNSTLFTINATTGRISFTPNASDEGLHTINITATDDDGLSASRTMTLNITLNRPPTLLALATLSCQEDENCTASLEATDLDGDALTFSVTLVNSSVVSGQSVNATPLLVSTSDNTTTFSKNYTNPMVGNYTYNVTVTDGYGTSDNALWNVTVNNTNDAPSFDQNIDLPTAVIGYLVSYQINASDDDFLNVEENLSVSISLYGPNTSLLAPQKTGQSQWLLSFTPAASDLGNYSANITLSDDDGASVMQTHNFTVYNQSQPPNITQAQPYHNGTATVLALGSVSTESTAITLSENQTYTFDVAFTDPDSAADTITVTWSLDGTTVGSAAGDDDYSLSQSFDFFDAGTHTMIVNVTDERYASDTFQWNITVTDVNRPPQRIGTLADRVVNSTLIIYDYLSVFYDPDDDLDSNGQIDGAETNTLTYTYTENSYLTASFQGTNTTLTPQESGVVDVTYTASDGTLTADSNTVSYTVIKEEEETVVTRSSGGGGGGSSAVPIPVTADPEPFSIDIIAPQPVTIYLNETIAAPLIIHNPSDRTLRGITLSASAAVDNVTFEFSRDEFEQLATNQNESVTLYITNYRGEGTYEIKVHAEVDDPEINDSAVIFVNSLEKGSEGDQMQTKVTFARDLLAANPECVELNELIGQAQRAMATGQRAEADKILNAVIDGCRYLVSNSDKREEVPAGLDLSAFRALRHANLVLGMLLAMLVSVAGLLVWHYRSAVEED